MGDYLKCPRAYYLKNVYKDPKTHHKISIMSPALALGQSVHEVIESLSILPVSERFSVPLAEKFNQAWAKVEGQKGGFKDSSQEAETHLKGLDMLQRVTDHPGPILRKTVKIRQELPYFWLSEEDNIILCGKIDWLEYDEATDGVRILDFKTGKYDEDPDSLQLPIYLLLASKCQSRTVEGVSYWYLGRDNAPTPVNLPDTQEALARVLSVAKKVALARKLNHFQCPKISGCRDCLPLEAAASGKGKFVGVNDFGQDVYVI